LQSISAEAGTANTAHAAIAAAPTQNVVRTISLLPRLSARASRRSELIIALR